MRRGGSSDALPWARLFHEQADVLATVGLYPVQILAQQRRLRDELQAQEQAIAHELSQTPEGHERWRLQATLRHTRLALEGYHEVAVGPQGRMVEPSDLRRAETRCTEVFVEMHGKASDESERELLELFFCGRYFPPAVGDVEALFREVAAELGLD